MYLYVTVINAYIAVVRNEHVKSCGLEPDLKRNILYCQVLHFDSPNIFHYIFIQLFPISIDQLAQQVKFSLLPSYCNSMSICEVINVLIITYSCPMWQTRNQCLRTKPFTTHSLRLQTGKKLSFFVAQLPKFFLCETFS